MPQLSPMLWIVFPIVMVIIVYMSMSFVGDWGYFYDGNSKNIVMLKSVKFKMW